MDKPTCYCWKCCNLPTEMEDQIRKIIAEEEEGCMCGPWDHCGCTGQAVNRIEDLLDANHG